MSGKLNGKTALITGASKGLGKAMAVAWAAEGARFALVARDTALLNAVAAEISSNGNLPGAFTADLTVEDQVLRLEQEVVAQFGKIDILSNNAGVNVRKSVTVFSLAEWRLVMETN